jgi:trk system potassium uptake protein TrkA
MRVIIVGGGQVGSYLASLLIANNHEVHVIENRKKVFNKLEKELPNELLIFGSGSDPEIMKKAGITTADVVAAVTGTDEVNLVVSTLSKMEYGIKRVIARVNNPKNAWLFNEGMGVDVGINQADIMAHFVVNEMRLEDVFSRNNINKN